MKSPMTIQNVVASTTLAEDFDLPKIEAGLESAEYHKTKFTGLFYRAKDQYAAFLTFTSGKK
jgi:transcription initiation factor TFIID TATA-box-binding protein